MAAELRTRILQILPWSLSRQAGLRARTIAAWTDATVSEVEHELMMLQAKGHATNYGGWWRRRGGS